jgi:hypothetical protein
MCRKLSSRALHMRKPLHMRVCEESLSTCLTYGESSCTCECSNWCAGLPSMHVHWATVRSLPGVHDWQHAAQYAPQLPRKHTGGMSENSVASLRHALLCSAVRLMPAASLASEARHIGCNCNLPACTPVRYTKACCEACWAADARASAPRRQARGQRRQARGQRRQEHITQSCIAPIPRTNRALKPRAPGTPAWPAARGAAAPRRMKRTKFPGTALGHQGRQHGQQRAALLSRVA